MTTLKLYHRSDCHLCELAFALLADAGLTADIQPVDIDSDPFLGVDLAVRIPVLERSDGQQLDWPFDQAAVQAFLLP